MRHITAVGVVFCILCWLGTACQAPSLPPTNVPLPTVTPSVPTRTPMPTPGPLTDAEAIALVQEEATARGVAPHTLRIIIESKSRSASIRYSSAYAVDSAVFQAQTVLVALATARAMVRVRPPISGGIRLAVVPGGESEEVGLKVIVIGWPILEAWANGSISDQEFVSQWTEGAITKE